LQFVVLTLIAEQPVLGSAEAGAAFATPTIVHFGTALLLASLIRVPWHAIAPAAVLWGLVGAAGALYVLLVARRMRAQKAYLPEMEDWLFHVALPFAAYAALALSAPAAASHLRAALFVVGGAALVLLFIGIHNAWDAVSYHVFVNMRKAKD
jgi:hypothetical protein